MCTCFFLVFFNKQSGGVSSWRVCYHGGLVGPEGCPKPGQQRTNKSEQILANLEESEQTGQTVPNRAKNGHFRQKWGKKRAKLGKNRQKMGLKKNKKNGQTKPNPGKTGRNRKFCQI